MSRRRTPEEILAAHASPFVLQSGPIDCYFRGAEVCGTPSHPFARFIVALARPDAAQLSSHDYPRVMIVEAGALRRIMEEDVLPQYDTKDGRTWLQTVRELGRAFFGGDRRGTVILKIPLSPESEWQRRPLRSAGLRTDRVPAP